MSSLWLCCCCCCCRCRYCWCSYCCCCLWTPADWTAIFVLSKFPIRALHCAHYWRARCRSGLCWTLTDGTVICVLGKFPTGAFHHAHYWWTLWWRRFWIALTGWTAVLVHSVAVAATYSTFHRLAIYGIDGSHVECCTQAQNSDVHSVHHVVNIVFFRVVFLEVSGAAKLLN